MFHRGQYMEPSRFIDFLSTPSYTVHVFGTTGIGLRNFLFQILLGAELALRLVKMGSAQKYPNVMTPTTSALAVTACNWMENVTVRMNANGRYIVTSMNQPSQAEGLLRFAEAIGWPYMDEARQNIEGLYNKIISDPSSVHDYLKY
jgi:hypothetical protein